MKVHKKTLFFLPFFRDFQAFASISLVHFIKKRLIERMTAKFLLILKTLGGLQAFLIKWGPCSVVCVGQTTPQGPHGTTVGQVKRDGATCRGVMVRCIQTNVV